MTLLALALGFLAVSRAERPPVYLNDCILFDRCDEVQIIDLVPRPRPRRARAVWLDAAPGLRGVVRRDFDEEMGASLRQMPGMSGPVEPEELR